MSILDKMAQMFNSSQSEMKSQMARFKNRKYLEGTVAICAYISLSSNDASPEEKNKMMKFISQSDELNVFPVEEVIEIFDKLATSFSFDQDVGKGQAMKYILQLKEQPDLAQLAIRVGIAVAKSDGVFDEQEKNSIREICIALGCQPSDYGL